ncbi:fungal-specific transcription factor domain-containing protein [Xylaria cubensis]|nr:fungal-specific transcription factor domain-containing protein [Xylaria cubensis]
MQRTPESILSGAVVQKSSQSMLPAGKATACYRCHERKVKCSGGRPCHNCQQSDRADECSYPLRNRTIKVRQSFIDGLLQDIERLKRQSISHPQSGNNHAIENDGIDDMDPSTEVAQQSSPSTRPETSVDAPNDETETSPVLSNGPWFDSLNVFKSPVLIGEAADAAFATRFRQVIADPATPKPTHLLRLNYTSNESLMSLTDASTTWPGPSRARFLLEAAMKYIGRCYHIVQRQVALDGWERINRDPSRGSPILRSRYWALFAIGELYITKSIGTGGFPGLAYFAQASKALGYLDERPEVESVELYLLFSFYSMALNRRYSAYLFAGTAMRTAIVIGLHLNIPGSQLTDARLREHRKRLFWTAYVIDRLCASNLNHPPAIQDDDIGVDLPSDVSISTLTEDDGNAYCYVANIKLAELLTAVIRSVYRVQTQAEGTCANLSSRVQVCLKNLQTWFGNLPPPLQIDDNSMDEPHDLKVVSLHLRFYQCVILATRPLLLHALRIQIVASRSNASTPSSKVPPSATALSQACIRCAHHCIRLLKRAWIDGTFVTFDCFFTQHLFSSLTILAISSLLDGVGSQHDRESYEEASRLLDQLKVAGNLVAQEYCHHVEAIESTLLAHMKINLPSQLDASSTIAGGLAPTADMPWPEPSLQQLLSQPALDLHFLEAAVREEYSQCMYWPATNANS